MTVNATGLTVGRRQTIAMRFTRQHSASLHGIEIQGSPEFIERTQESLALLHSLPEFEIIDKNIAVIRQARRSGMKAWLKKPTFNVGKPTWNHSAHWYAGVIAHDGYHAKLYRDAKPANENSQPDADSWTGAAAESRCLEFQGQVLRRLDADEKLIRYVESCQANPTYQGRNRGLGSWLDYLRRWW